MWLQKKKIYLIRKRGIGDVLWIEPVLHQLSKTFKKVIVYTKYPDLFLNYPAKNVEIRYNLSIFEKFIIQIEKLFRISFLTINLEKSYEKKPHQHFLHAYQQKARLALTNEVPKLYLTNNGVTYENERIAVFNISTISGAENYRNVYGIDWKVFLKFLESKGYKIIEIGTSPGLFRQYYKNTTVREMIHIISKASCFIGLDSGPSHIAAALKIPSIIFFGAVKPEYRHFKEHFTGFILQNHCQFAGCYHEKKLGKKMVCRIVGEKGIPPCCSHTTNEILDTFLKLEEKYINV